MKHLVLILFSLSIFACSEQKTEHNNTTDSTQNIPEASISNLSFDFQFPLTLPEFITKNGKPQSTLIDSISECPMGQFHFWGNNQTDFNCMILEDNYSQEITFDNSSRLYLIKNNKLIDDLNYFKYDQKSISAYLATQPSEIISHTVLTKMSALESTIFPTPLHGLFIVTKDKFITLRFNEDGSLAYILISEFDVNMAC